MVKTTPLNDDTHKCLKVAQTILYEKYNIQMPIPDVIAAVICDVDQIVDIVLEKNKIVKTNIENVDTHIPLAEEDIYAGK